MAIYRLLQNSPMGPEEISRLGAAYEQTPRALHLKNRNDPITEMIAKKIVLWAATAALVLIPSLCLAADTYEVTLERGVTATMRDGVVLRADIYRPKADGRFPVLLQRTPYDKRNSAEFAWKAAAHGFVAVVGLTVWNAVQYQSRIRP